MFRRRMMQFYVFRVNFYVVYKVHNSIKIKLLGVFQKENVCRKSY